MIEIPLDVCGHSLIHSRFEKLKRKREEEVAARVYRKRLSFLLIEVHKVKCE